MQNDYTGRLSSVNYTGVCEQKYPETLLLTPISKHDKHFALPMLLLQQRLQTKNGNGQTRDQVLSEEPPHQLRGTLRVAQSVHVLIAAF